MLFFAGFHLRALRALRTAFCTAWCARGEETHAVVSVPKAVSKKQYSFCESSPRSGPMDASPDAFEGLQELPQPARPSLEAGCFPLAAGGSPELPVRLSLPADAHAGDDADAAAASAAAAKKKRRGKPRSAAAAEQPARQATRFTRQILQPAVPPRPVRRFGDETCIDPTHSLLCTRCGLLAVAQSGPSARRLPAEAALSRAHGSSSELPL